MDVDFNLKWAQLGERLASMVGKSPDLNGILFLIGVQELGKGKQDFSKEQKQDLMHIATCKLLSTAGFYALEGQDEEGWPLWKQLKPLPLLTLKEQETFLKTLVLEYFDDLDGF